LIGAGLVVREVCPGPPLRTVYRLTEAGHALEPALQALGSWARTCLRHAGTSPGAPGR
jgi:DNA-binding HxlR family transcriptional regulator